jgi:hypothetical protein
MQVECENFIGLDSCERATNIDDAWLQCEQPSIIITETLFYAPSIETKLTIESRLVVWND